MVSHRRLRRQARTLTPLSTLLTGATELDGEAAVRVALGVLDIVQVVCARLIAAGVIEPASLRADLERQLELRQRDRPRAMAAAILLDGLGSASDPKRGIARWAPPCSNRRPQSRLKVQREEA